MNNPLNIKNLFSLDRFPLTYTDLIVFIDEIHTPILLFNPKTRAVICGNTAFMVLTKFGNPEIIHLKIDQIIQHGLTDYRSERYQEPAKLLTKEGKKLPVRISLKNIARDGVLSMLKVEPAEESEIEEQKPFEMMDRFMELIHAAREGRSNDVMKGIVQAANLFFGTKNTAIYQNSAESLLRQNENTVFPDILPIIESERLSSIDVWHPGKRTLCEIHRVGRKANFKGLLTGPISNQGFSGLLVTEIQSEAFYRNNEETVNYFLDWVNEIISLAVVVEREQTEKQILISQKAGLSKFAEITNDLLIVLDSENRIEFVNQPFLKFLSYASYEVANKPISQFMDDIEILQFEHGDIKEGDISVHDRAGNNYQMKYSVIKTEDYGAAKTIIRLTDQTQFKNLSRSLSKIQKQALLGESIADFAHDARNPLNNISTGLQMVRAIYKDNAQLVESVDRMQADCIRMSDLIESVLSYSRQDFEKFSNINLSSLIESVYKRFEKKFENNNISHSYLNSFQEPLIHGDYRSLERIFINLVNNSIESMEASGGELSIVIKSSDEQNEEIEVSIADTGPGIPKEILERIFEPYISGKKSGTGLGLAITKKIIDAHNAKIKIESFTSGTIFRLFFTRVMEETK